MQTIIDCKWGRLKNSPFFTVIKMIVSAAKKAMNMKRSKSNVSVIWISFIRLFLQEMHLLHCMPAL